MTDQRAGAAAAMLWEAWLGGDVLERLADDVRPRSAAEGWQAQEALEALAGRRCGWKLAATTAAGRRHIQVERALPGRLFPRFLHEPGETLPLARVLRVAEAEIAFRLGRDLDGAETYDEAAVLGAVEAVHLAIELPDTRIRCFDSVGEAQLLADDACAGRFVLGPSVAGWQDIDLAILEVSVRVNGADAARGLGENVMGDPRHALTWLANELVERGTPLRGGEVVTTGTITVPVPIGPGDRLEALFGELGSVAVGLAA